jgi:hypothetical protein
MGRSIKIDPKRHCCGKPLGVYDPNNDAFKKYKGPTETPPSGIGKIDWSRLDLNKVETMVTQSNGVAQWDALIKAKEQGKIIIPNQVHDRMLVETEHYKKDDIKAGYAARTGTMIIYESPDKAFGESIVFSWEHDNVNYSITFSIPEKFRGKTNCALVIEHPDFELVSLGDNNYELKVADGKSISLLVNFPKEGGGKGYEYDEKTRIPSGTSADELTQLLGAAPPQERIRYLYRVAGSYIGLLARSYDVIGWRQGVYAIDGPSDALGVHVIGPEEAAKLKIGE